MRANLALVILTLVASDQAWTGTQTGTITYLTVRDSDGLTYFNLTGASSGKPACATQAYWMIKNETTEAGKKIYALLLAAQASGATVIVTGYDTCTRWNEGEDVNTIRTSP
jgi:hypothetical protein